jgi:hypothetical protein
MKKSPNPVRYRLMSESIGIHLVWFALILGPAGSWLFLFIQYLGDPAFGGLTEAAMTAVIGAVFGALFVLPGILSTALVLIPVLVFVRKSLARIVVLGVFPTASYSYFSIVGGVRLEENVVIVTLIAAAAAGLTVVVYDRIDLFELKKRRQSLIA